MNRRDFFGMTLGLVVAAPILATTACPPSHIAEGYARLYISRAIKVCGLQDTPRQRAALRDWGLGMAAQKIAGIV